MPFNVSVMRYCLQLNEIHIIKMKKTDRYMVIFVWEMAVHTLEAFKLYMCKSIKCSANCCHGTALSKFTV